VFGTQLDEQGAFPPFVPLLIDRAVDHIRLGRAPKIVFCGSHPLKAGYLRGPKECDAAEAYLRHRHPGIIARGQFYKEDRSTSVPENWLFLKQNFPHLRRLHLVTIAPLLPRIRFLGDWIYGDNAALSFESLSWTRIDFPHEPRMLRNARCTLTTRNQMRRGDHGFLLKKDGSSRWDELRLDHHACPCHNQD
jgi:hypothetical protein